MILSLTCCSGLLAQTSSGSVFQPTRFEGTVKLDGILDEEVWSSATVIDDFMQALPKVGGPPTERTEVKIIYDDQYLYVGVMAYDSAPGLIVARGMERDVYYSGDDGIGFVLDTYNDKRQAIGFFTNALGARFDEEFIANGDTYNPAYNTFWNVRSRINESGFAVEFQIPFSSLRFEPKDETVMEFKIIRYIRHKNEFAIYPPAAPETFNLIWRVNTSREIGFNKLKTKRPLYLIPYIRGSYQEQKNPDVTSTQIIKKSEFAQRNSFASNPVLDKVISNVGVDLKYGVSKNFTLDATINTDFAQAEADNRIINLTRFSVNLPEKRGFFLESTDYLGFATTQTQLFYSRRIGLDRGYVVPILGGLRLTGKSNGYQIGALDIQTLGLSQANVAAENFGVLRVRKEILKNGSFVGAIVTNRMSTTDRSISNQVVGLDFLGRYGNKWITGFNAATSSDKRNPGLFKKSTNVSVFLNRTANLGYTNTTVLEYSGENFKPLMGFAPDSGYLNGNMYNEYRWQLKNSTKANQFRLSNQLSARWRESNKTMESVLANIEAGLFFKNGILLSFSPSWSREYVPYDWQFAGDIVIPRKYYDLGGYTFSFLGRQTSILNYSVTASSTNYYGGRNWAYTGTISYALNKHFSFRTNGQVNFIRFPDHYSSISKAHYRTVLISGSVVYTQSIYFSVRLFTQYDNLSKTIGANVRIRYNPREGTDLYLVYSPRINSGFPGHVAGETQTIIDRQVIILKFIKTLSL